MHKPKTCSYYS